MGEPAKERATTLKEIVLEVVEVHGEEGIEKLTLELKTKLKAIAAGILDGSGPKTERRNEQLFNDAIAELETAGKILIKGIGRAEYVSIA